MATKKIPVASMLEREQGLLEASMKRCDGTPFRGPKAIITMKRNGTQCYLSGMPYLWTMFPERAYEIDEGRAREWITRYSIVLGSAQVHVLGE